MTEWQALAFVVGLAFGSFFGYLGGYCRGWLMGTNAADRRWSEAVGRADDARKRVAP